MTIIFCPANHANVYTGVDTNEKINCSIISDWAVKRLKQLGFDAVSLDSNYKALEMVESIKMIQNTSDTFVVCLHTNARGGNARGLEVMGWWEAFENYIPTEEYAKQAKSDAYYIYNNLPDHVRHYYDGEYKYKQSSRVPYSFAGTEYTLTKSRGVYIELDYHDKEDSAKFLAGQEVALGYALADCIASMFKTKDTIRIDFSLEINLKTGEVKLL